MPPAQPPQGFDGMPGGVAHTVAFPAASAARSVLSMISGDFHLNRLMVARPLKRDGPGGWRSYRRGPSSETAESIG